MSDRIEPDTLSWSINADSIFREEVAFHGSDGDLMVIEIFDRGTDSWVLCERDLRFTIYRDAALTKEES